jgi:G3E family GTPase
LKLHVLSGFLGSGKTTAIQLATMELVRKKVRTAVITNDQGMKLVDSAFFRKEGVPFRQVVNGCFCCNFSKLASSIHSLVENEHPEEIFAETVGSCTDLVATVIRPLLERHPGTALSFSVFADARLLYLVLSGNQDIFQENVRYIYLKQLEEATLIIVNKIDLVSQGLLGELKKMLSQKYPGKRLLFQNSLRKESIRVWLETIHGPESTRGLPPLEVDYDRYAAGEASLAWLDQEVEIVSAGETAGEEAIRFANTLYSRLRQGGHPIGHLKFIVDEEMKISFASMSDPLVEESLFQKKAARIKLLINARVETDPETLESIVSGVISQTERSTGNKIFTLCKSVFQPGYPAPEFRIPG